MSIRAIAWSGSSPSAGRMNSHFGEKKQVLTIRNLHARAEVNAVRKHRGQPELDGVAFLKLVKEKMKVLHIGDELLKRPVNEGFSGGEKKRNEIFQMAVLDPRFAILDETDSGLDIDALRIVADGVNRLRGPERGIVVVTHYQRLLNYIVPDYVHILMDGR